MMELLPPLGDMMEAEDVVAAVTEDLPPTREMIEAETATIEVIAVVAAVSFTNPNALQVVEYCINVTIDKVFYTNAKVYSSCNHLRTNQC